MDSRLRGNDGHGVLQRSPPARPDPPLSLRDISPRRAGGEGSRPVQRFPSPSRLSAPPHAAQLTSSIARPFLYDRLRPTRLQPPTATSMNNPTHLTASDHTRPHAASSAHHASKSDQIRPNLNKPEHAAAQFTVPVSRSTIPVQKFALPGLKPPPWSIWTDHAPCSGPSELGLGRPRSSPILHSARAVSATLCATSALGDAARLRSPGGGSCRLLPYRVSTGAARVM